MADQNVQINLTAQNNLSPTISQLMTELFAFQTRVDEAGTHLKQLESAVLAGAARLRELQGAATGAGPGVQTYLRDFAASVQKADAELKALTATQAKSTQETAKHTEATKQGHAAHSIWGEALTQSLEPLREHIGGVGQLTSAFQALAAPVALAREHLSQHGLALSSILTLSGGVVAGTVALGAALIGLAAKVAENRKEFGEMAERLGVSLPFLQALTASARIAGVDIESLGRGFTRFNANLAEAAKGAAQGGQAYSNLVTTLGLSRAELESFDRALLAVAAQWGNMSAQDRDRVGMQLFSLNVAQVNKLLNELHGEHLVKFKEKMDSLNATALAEGVALSKAYFERMADLATKFVEFWQTIGVTAFIPAANSILDWLTRIPGHVRDIRDAVQSVGEATGVVAPPVSLGPAVQAAPASMQGAFTAAGRKFDIDPNLLARIAQVESNFDPRAVNSTTGAAGVMQILPSTARAYNRPGDTSIELGAEILRDMITEFKAYSDATRLGTLAYRAGTVAIWEAVHKVEATGQIATAATLQPFVTAASRKYYQDIFGAVASVSAGVAPVAPGTEGHGTLTEGHGAASAPGAGTLSLAATEALNRYRDALKTDAQALEAQAIQTQAALLEQQQGKVVAEQYRLAQLQALKLRQVSEDVDRASMDALGGVPQQITIYKQRIAQFSDVLLDLTQQHATLQARQSLPQMEALLTRIAAFTGRPEESAGAAAQAQVLVRGTELQKSVQDALKQIRLMPELTTLAPELHAKLTEALATIPATIETEGARQAALANEKLHAQIVKIGADIGASGLAPLDAALAGIRQKFTAAQEALSQIAKQGVGAEDAGLIAQIQSEMGTRQQAAIDAATSKATIDLQRHVTDLSLTIGGAGEESRQRELLKIAQWGEDMRSEIEKILGPGGLPVGSEALRPQLEMLLTRIAPAQERKTLESSDFYHTMLSAAHSIEQTFSTLWENILTGGIKSFRDLGLQIAQSLQHTFAQISAQLMNAIMNGLSGTTEKEGGWAGALVQVLGKLAVSAIGGSIGAGAGAGAGAGGGGGGGPLLSPDIMGSAGGNVFPHGLGTIRMLAGGGIVDRPSFTTLAEMGRPEAVVPLSEGRSIPVEMRGGGAAPVAQQPMIIEIHNDYSNAVSPSSLKTGKREIIQHVISDIRADSSLRRVIQQYAR